MLNVWVSKVPLKLEVGPLNLGVGCMLVRFGLKGALKVGAGYPYTCSQKSI